MMKRRQQQRRTQGRHLLRRGALVMVVAAAACGDGTGTGDPASTNLPTFTVQVATETFRLRASDAATVAALRNRMQTGTLGVILGSLVSGNGGFNTPWGWHLDPATVVVPDVATEVCDGRPSDVQGNMPYWINTVRRFCPWGARVVSESPGT